MNTFEKNSKALGTIRGFLWSVFLIILLLCQNIRAQQGSLFENFPDSLNKKRFTYLVLTESLLYAGSMTALYYAWYSDYPQSKFHFFNDNDEWMYMDKLGHLTTSATLSKITHDFYRWTGIKSKDAIWAGGATGLFYLTVIEILDGFSAQWGASPGDLIFNTGGTLFFMGQQYLWNEQRAVIKYSFSPTEYADYRPDLFGKTTIENALKDYNGQTYWLSANIASFARKDTGIPRWLNVAIGYSPDGMLGAVENPEFYRDEKLPSYARSSQYLLSLDVDFTRIKTKSKLLKLALIGLNFIKVPFPALEYNTHSGFKMKGLYF